MKSEKFRDLQLFQELAQNPHITQRNLGKRMGFALGLINLHLHRFSTQGFIKIVEVEKNRTQYLLTQKGILERDRLVADYLDQSIRYYRDVRRFLREHLLELAKEGVQRVLLFGTGELAEISYLTIQEVGLTLSGVIGDREKKQLFFNLPVRSPAEIASMEFERVIVATPESHGEDWRALVNLGVPPEKMIRMPQDPGLFLGGDGIRSMGDRPAGVSVAGAPVSGWRPEPANTDVVILCGGKGTRLKSLTGATPKPLLPIGREPFLLRLLLRLKQEGFRRFILAAHYLPHQFELFLEEYRPKLKGVHLIIEPEPLGTGGALRHAVDYVVSSHFVILNGDTWVHQAMTPVLEEHARAAREFTVVVIPADRVEGEALKKGVWQLGPNDELLGFETQEAVSEGWVNAGRYILSRGMVASWPVGSYSLEANLSVLLSGRKSGVYRSQGRLLDIGTPQTYGRAAELLESYESSEAGILNQRSSSQ